MQTWESIENRFQNSKHPNFSWKLKKSPKNTENWSESSSFSSIPPENLGYIYKRWAPTVSLCTVQYNAELYLQYTEG